MPGSELFQPVEYPSSGCEKILFQLGRVGINIVDIHAGADILRTHGTRQGVAATDVYVVTDLSRTPPGDLDEATIRTGHALAYLHTTGTPNLIIASMFHKVPKVSRETLGGVEEIVHSQDVFGIADINTHYPPTILLGAVDLRTGSYLRMKTRDPRI
jgi:hypothetical protein